MQVLRAGNLRFDRSLLRTGGTGDIYLYGGVEAVPARARLPQVGLGLLQEPYSLYAMGLLPSRPTPGSHGFPVFEPPPGWSAPGSLPRYPRLCCFHAPDSFISWGDVFTRGAAVADALAGLGVTTVFRNGSNNQTGFHPLVSLWPVLTSTEVVVPGTGRPPVSNFFRHAQARVPAADLFGGDILVFELNPFNWTVGVGSQAWHQTTFVLGDAGHPVVPPAGTVAFAPLSGGDDTHDRVLLWQAEIAADGPPAVQFAARCRSYRHLVYHADATTDNVGVIDHDAVWAAGVGGLGLPFVARRVVSTTDRDATWARIMADAIDFFS